MAAFLLSRKPSSQQQNPSSPSWNGFPPTMVVLVFNNTVSFSGNNYTPGVAIRIGWANPNAGSPMWLSVVAGSAGTISGTMTASQIAGFAGVNGNPVTGQSGIGLYASDPSSGQIAYASTIFSVFAMNNGTGGWDYTVS